MKSLLFLILFFITSSLHAELVVSCFDTRFTVNPNIEYTYSQIKKKFDSLIKDKDLILKFDEEIYTIPYSKMFQLAARDLKTQISKIRKSQSRWDRLNLSLFNKTKSYKLKPILHPQVDLLTNKIEEINSFYEKTLTPARVNELAGYRKIFRDVSSERIDLKKALKDFSDNIKSNLLTSPNIKISLTKVNISPSRTFDYFREKLGFKYLISEKITKFDITDVNRNANLLKAVKSIDGIIIYPYETFSYNKILGPRTLKAGYKTGLGILGGKLVPSVGGGICQISSTLYKPVLMSGLKIIEQHNHSMRGPGLDYVPMGEDAAVVYSYKDFSFKNTFSSRKFLVSAMMKEDKIIIKIYSNEKNIYTYKLAKSSRTRGKRLSVKLWRESYKDNKLVSKEYITSNNYTLFFKHP